MPQVPRVCDSLFVAALIGAAFTAVLVLAPRWVLQVVLSPGRWRSQCGPLRKANPHSRVQIGCTHVVLLF